MFKVESYISPFILGYINKYVKLKQEDFQLSLWGGDAVLNKLDLRLDVLEGALHLPICFKSGHIHELRLHVPWTKLGSEPVVITINTIECVLRLRDSAYGDDDSSSLKSVASSSKLSQTASVKPKPIKPQGEEELPPGYLQSLMNRIMHNVNIVVNNLILKFVEDDIVLSVNVKSAECYSVNKDWGRAFIELAMPELVLRRVVDFQDLTVCLDKRNASGKIETYQDPLLYRCSLTCRLHMNYDSLHSKLPSLTKFNMLCEKLDLSLTDTQVPMFFRLIELCVALYYGTLDMPDTEPTQSEDDVGADAVMVDVPSSPHHDPSKQEGWVSWAWSYVPAVLPSGEYEEDEEFEEDFVGIQKRAEMAVIAIGVYINKASVMFKLSEYIKESPYYSSQKVQFRPCLLWECEAIGLEVILRGLNYFNVQFGITGTKVVGLGEAICGVRDLDSGSRDPNFLRGGLCLDTMPQHPHFHLSQSLFDPGGPENQGVRPTYNFDTETHNQQYTEQFVQQKFGAFWMDYIFTMDDIEGEGGEKQGGSKSSQSNLSTSVDLNVRENSTISFVLGPAQLNVCSSMVQRVHKFIYCMAQHDYEPYSRPKHLEVEETAPPSDEIVSRLEEFIPTRTYHFTMLRPTICVLATDLPEYDVSKRKTISRKSSKKSSKSKSGESSVPGSTSPLPTLVIQAERFDLQTTSAMYPKYLVKVVSMVPAPSSNLIHHAHTHMYIKVFGLQAGLTAVDPGRGMFPIQSILQPSSGVYYKKTLLLPKYWKNPLQAKVEHTYELPQLTVSLSKPQVLLLAYLGLSWLQTNPTPSLLHSVTLLDDVFKPKSAGEHPILECGVSGLEVKHCDSEAVFAITGTLSTIQALLLCSGNGRSPVTPILYGPVDTSKVHNGELFSRKEGIKQEVEKQDLVTFTLQFPKNPTQPQGPATLLAHICGVAVCCDPLLQDWLHYTPGVITPATTSRDTGQPPVIDNSLLEATSPLKTGSESHSGSTVTNPTDSHTGTTTQSQTQTTSQPLVLPKLAVPTESGAHTDPHDPRPAPPGLTWANMLGQVYPVLKMMQVQVDVRSCVIFLPEKHVRLSEPSADIPGNLRMAWLAGNLPHTIVTSLPAVKVSCTGHKPISPVQDIPIKTLEHSVAGEKLPWSVRLEHCAAYTVHPSVLSGTSTLPILEPASLSATIAITTKYSSPLSDKITSLGLCIHADMDAVTVKCSKPQLQLACDLAMTYIASFEKVKVALSTLHDLHIKGFKTQSSSPDTMHSTVAPPPLFGAKSFARNASSSGLLDQGELGLATITETSESVSHGGTSPRDMTEDDQVRLSLWLQWTLVKFVVKVYMQKDMLLRSEMEDITTAIDIQDIFTKLRFKIGAFAIHHFTGRHGEWRPGSYNGVILSSTDQLNRNIPIATNKHWTSQPESPTRMFTTDDPKLPDSNLGFLSLTFTRALQTNVEKKLQKSGLPGRGGTDDEEEEELKKKKVPTATLR